MAAPTPLTIALHENRTSGRTRGLLIAVVLGCVLVVTGSILGASMQHRVSAGAGVAHEGVDIVVRSEQGAAVDTDAALGGGSSMSPGDVSSITELPGVASTRGLSRGSAALWAGDSVLPTVLESVPSGDFAWQRLDEGRLPEEGTEIALNRDLLRDAGLRVGDTVVLGNAASGQAAFTVVGSVDTRGALAYQATGYGLVTLPVASAIAGIDGVNEVTVRLEPGADPDEIISAINSTTPVGWPQKASEIVSATEQVYGIGMGVLTAMINGFALIAAMIAVVVLAAVVWASLPGRRERFAMLRLIGATRGQLASIIALETGIIALLGAILALPLGIAAAYIVVPLVGHIPGVPALTWSDIKIPVAPMIAVPLGALGASLVAALVPMASVARISPAGARRATSTPTAAHPARTATLFVAVIAAVVFVFVAALHLGIYWTAAAGALVAVLWIAATPAVARILAGRGAALTAHRFPVASLTLSGIQRFPGRAAATGLGASLAAVVIAVSLVTLSSVAAISAARTSSEPVSDLMVGAYAGSGSLGDTTLDQLSEVDGVHGAVPITASRLTLVGPSSDTGFSDRAETRLSGNVVAVDVADLLEVSEGRFPLTEVAGDELYLPESTVPPFADGAEVTVRGPDGEVTLTARYVEDLPFPQLVAPSVLDQLGATPQVPAVWLSVADDADRTTVLDSVRAIATVAGDLPVSGPAVSDARVDGVISIARGLAIGMLAVAVLIAVIGAAVIVSTTLRQRATEMSVLRLLGMNAASLRRSVSAETWTVGTLSVVAGLALGITLGCAATLAVATELGLDPLIRIPIITVIILGAATVLGLRMAASSPLDRVSTVPPARALRASTTGENS